MRSVFEREQKSQAPGAASAQVGFEALAWKLGGVGRIEGPRARRRAKKNRRGAPLLRGYGYFSWCGEHVGHKETGDTAGPRQSPETTL
jgi:hypothetical protein